MNKKILDYIKFFLGWPVIIIAFGFMLRTIAPKWGEIYPFFYKLNVPFLIIGILSFFAYYLLRAAVWKLMLNKKGHQIPYKDTLAIWEISEFKRYIPGNIWSFISRGISFSERGVKKSEIVTLMGFEILLIIAACLAMSYFAIPYIIDQFWIGYKSELTVLIRIAIVSILFGFIFSKSLKIKLLSKYFFEPATNFKLLCISVLSFLFFGIGSYFTAISVFAIDARDVLINVGLFNLALLGGYLSFITPMGFGVREGIIILALRSKVGILTAGLIALVTRVFLILSEVLFLLFILSIKDFNTKKIESFLARNWEKLILATGLLIYNIYFNATSFIRHDNFYSGRFDLGNMDQVVWNSLNGRIFEMTNPNGTETISRLAFHADYLLVFLAPFYAIWSSPKMLMIIQTFVLSLGAVYTFLIAKRILKDNIFPLMFSLAYLIYPALNYVNLYDFHPVALATTFLLAAFYYLQTQRYILFAIFAVLAGISKEQVWLIISLIGLYVIYKSFKDPSGKKKLRLIGVSTFIVSFIIFYLLIWKMIPAARGGSHFALEYYSEFGESPTIIAKNIVLSPLLTTAKVLEPAKTHYLNQLISPLGYFSLLNPAFLVMALPDFAITLLSNNKQLYQIYYQYSSTITPFIFISSIYGLAFFLKRTPVSRNLIYLYLGFFICYSAYSFGPLPGSKNPSVTMFNRPLEYGQKIKNIFLRIPESSSVSSTNNLGSHLSQREKIYTVPFGMEEADFVAFLLTDPYALKAEREMVKKMQANPNYSLVFQEKDFYLFKKLTFYTENINIENKFARE